MAGGKLAVAGPGFPVGGRGPIGGRGRGPLTWEFFGENVCKNKRIGSHMGGGGMCQAHPLDLPITRKVFMILFVNNGCTRVSRMRFPH